MDYYIDAQDIQDLVLGVWSRVVLGIRKPAPDHRPSRLLVQEPLVLFILCILCIDVHKKIPIPRRYKPETSFTRLTGNMIYTLSGNRARNLVRASRISPPLRGSR